MQNKVIACVVGATAVIAVGAWPAVAKPKKTQKVTCHIRDFQQHAPTASTQGDDFGFVKCSGPFGKGVQYDTDRLMPKTQTSGTAILKFKAFFDRGTVSGVWHATYQFTSSTTAIFNQQHVEWTRGTGAFKHVRATGSGIGRLKGNVGNINLTVSVSGI